MARGDGPPSPSRSPSTRGACDPPARGPMTTTYDPFHPHYFDEADLRQEMNRVFDLCHGCRLCFKFCTAFPTPVRGHRPPRRPGLGPDDRGRAGPVVDECFNCKLCYVNCPYIPGQHEWELDFPRLMLRAEQVLHRNRVRSIPARITDEALGRTELAGKVGSALAPLANRVIEKPGGTGRRLLEKVAGIAGERVLPPYARERFSTWWRRRRQAEEAPGGPAGGRRGRAIVFPTCIVEYQAPQVGQGPRPGVRAQRRRVLGPRRARCAAAHRGCTRATSTTSGPRAARTWRSSPAPSAPPRPGATSRPWWCPSPPAATCSRTTTATTSPATTPSWWPPTPTTPPST